MVPKETRFHRDGEFVELEYHGGRQALRDMSDVIQSMVALMGDIAKGVWVKWKSLKEAQGLVLLDELEVHLHPRWKISIVERLRAACAPA